MNTAANFFMLGILFVILFGCKSRQGPEYSPEDRQKIENAIRPHRNQIDSLQKLLEWYGKEGNLMGRILVNKELGQRYRENSLFNEALRSHQSGLEAARALSDTLEIIQALNNLGTNYRRMGILGEASTYHYQALSLSERYSDRQSESARKSRLVSLNGIGNIHLTLNDWALADSVFRQALAGERDLQSDLGQAINCANIGSIFERKGLVDSALYYYQRSMAHNQAANSSLGISLCHTHFGRLAEQRGAWDEALREYQSAYNIMEGSRDRWHWLEACISLGRVNISKGDLVTGKKYTDLAERTASEIHSWDYLAQVYSLYYLISKSRGDASGALTYYVRSEAYKDSLQNEGSSNHMQNMRVNYEREKGSRELALVQENYISEQRNKRNIMIAGLCIFSLSLIAFGFMLYALRMKSRTQRLMRKMEQVKQSFFTNVTHEFRTPLTVILGLAEQLSKKCKDGEEKHSLDTISRQGSNLLELVNQLLDISKVSSEVDTPDWKHGDVVAYINMIVENYRIYARQQRIDLVFTPAEVSIHMDFVPSYLKKIVRNLLSNAIKYTPRGGQVYLTLAQEGHELVMTVADTGVGIAAEDLPHIFDSFYQGANSEAKIGTGVGLSLVRQMTEAMGGRIHVKSAPDSGAVFTLLFPLKHGEGLVERWMYAADTPANGAIAKEIEKSATTTEDSELLSVLIVEDNTDVATYIGSLLKTQYRLIFARNGSEGLEKAGEFMPDIILTDLMMPEMDGYEMCRRIRKSEILNHIPVIMITAKAEKADRVQGLDAGADAYLLKPFNADELYVRIAKLLEQRRLLREKYSMALSEGDVQNAEILPVDKDFLSRLTDLIYLHISDSSLNAEKLADKTFMSPSQLNRKIKSITGLSVAVYILQMRMERAKRLLASTDASIGDIASKCGFEDQSHFTRAFRQFMNLTPTQYRKQPKLQGA
jgi:Signal transduction histidine kinase